MTDQDGRCPRCGHNNDECALRRSLLDLVRRRPGRRHCTFFAPDDIGNGMAGGNSVCGCRSGYHQAVT